MSFETTPKNLYVLEKLAEELLKNVPEESVVTSFMKEAGLVDTKDPIDRINKVLQALHFEEKEKEFKS